MRSPLRRAGEAPEEQSNIGEINQNHRLLLTRIKIVAHLFGWVAEAPKEQ